jgi:hypothetical protein
MKPEASSLSRLVARSLPNGVTSAEPVLFASRIGLSFYASSASGSRRSQEAGACAPR